MGTKKSTRARGRKPVPVISHQPGKGPVVSLVPSFPETASEKIVCAKSIVQAVIAAHDSGNLSDQNYDISWPLEVAVTLLEQACEKVST